MEDTILTLLLSALLGLGGAVAFVFLVFQGTEKVAEVKMWCSHCRRKQWVEEELVRSWVDDIRVSNRIGSLKCGRCGEFALIPERPWC
ncbi:MAG: hypothetical protein ACE5JL_11740 [Dehalococcoidia bacterium]